MAAREEKKLPDLTSLAGLLLTFIALSGEVPANLTDHLSQTKRYREKVVESLKQKRFVHTYYRNGLRGLRLSASAKKLLLSNYPDWFIPTLTGSSETNQVKSEITRRLRLHLMAEVLVTMYNAGVVVFPWERPAIFQPDPPRSNCQIVRPAYYGSREIKEIGLQANKVRGSRATGVMLTDSGIFAVYNTGDFQMRWNYKAEIRFKTLLQIEVCQKRLPLQFANADLSAIVFGAGMERLDTLLGVGDGVSSNHFVLDGSYRHFYFLTCDRKGEVLLRLLCDGELRDTLDTILMEDLSPPVPDAVVENDAMNGDVFVLFGYTCDMPRLRRFDSSLQIHEKRGVVICFDFQLAAYRRCLGPQVQFQSLDFDQVVALVVNAPS